MLRAYIYVYLISRLFGFNHNTKCILCGSETDYITIHLLMYCQNNCSVQLKLRNSLYFKETKSATMNIFRNFLFSF